MLMLSQCRLSLWLCIAITLLGVGVATTTTPVADVAAPSWCSDESQFYCHKTDECKPHYVRCDGTKQCGLGEDEENCLECTAITASSLDKFYCNTSASCIQKDWKCDGTDDCVVPPGQKAEDEDNCPAAPACTEQEFDCGDGQCIDILWQCDIQIDCNNGADEQSCGEATCAHNQFTCNSTDGKPNECIADQWKCDGEKDCPNGEDELDCGKLECPTGRFNCSAENKCMPDNWRCDGDNDCASGEDEANCHIPVAHRQCAPLEFKCPTGRPMACIVGAWKCDGEEDCDDGADEKDSCPVKDSCSESEFTCVSDQICIPGFLTCSGKQECQDGSDEKLPRCGSNTTHGCDLAKGQFSCDDGTSTCVDVSKVCDFNSDCRPRPNGAKSRDEDIEFCGDNPTSDYCVADRCGDDPLITCRNIKTNQQISLNRTVGYVCECPRGYGQVDRKCHDKNECLDTESPVCDHNCVNSNGSYKCSCNKGYDLELDGRSCKVNGDVHPKLLFSNRHQIRSFHIHGHQEYMPLLDSTAAVALDFDYASSVVFYSDMKEKKLYKFSLPEPHDDVDELEEQDLKIDGIQTPDGLAYDWVYKHLYWTDTSTNTIHMACVDDEKDVPRKSVVLYQNANPNCTRNDARTSGNTVCIDEPRALAVHPRKGWAFWSDWGNQPHIVLAALDGSKMEMIAYNTGNNPKYLHWPNGLTIDLSTENERLYWIDAKLHSLFSCTINSCINDISVLVYNHDKIKHPFSITVFENQLYWSDWATRHIVSANKYTGGNITSILTDLEQPMDLKVFHPMSQPESTNHCLILPSEDLCDQICVPKPWARHAITTIFSPIPEHAQQHTCLCSVGYKLNADGRTCTSIEVKTAPSSSPSPDAEVSANRQGTDSAGGDSVSVGTVAAIASTVVLVLAVLVGVAIVVVMRRVKRNKSKRMNFDNPIYKKTTEDKLELPRHEYQPSQTDPSVMMPLTSSESTSTSNEDFDV